MGHLWAYYESSGAMHDEHLRYSWVADQLVKKDSTYGISYLANTSFDSFANFKYWQWSRKKWNYIHVEINVSVDLGNVT